MERRLKKKFKKKKEGKTETRQVLWESQLLRILDSEISWRQVLHRHLLDNQLQVQHCEAP